MRIGTAVLGVMLGGCVGSTTGTTNPPPDAGPAIPPRPQPLLSACFANRACRTPMVVAHRGEGGNAPENTIAAALEAYANGADVMEVDVRQTLDGELVLLHDSTLDRTTNQPDVLPGTPEVGTLTLVQVQSVTIKDPGNTCTPQNADSNPQRCRVPTLGALLQAVRGQVLVMLDYKDGDIAAVAQTVANAGALDTAFFFDSNEQNLDAAMQAGLHTMPRAQDAASTRDLIQRRTPYAVHIDPGYLADVQQDAQAAGVKLFLNLFLTVDFNLIAYSLTGDSQSMEDARSAMEMTLNNGAAMMQTDRAPEVRRLVDDWRTRHAQ